MAIEPLAAGDPANVAGYPLHGRLGGGGMGVVYLALQHRVDWLDYRCLSLHLHLENADPVRSEQLD